MKLATWNVNSIRARLPRVIPWLLTEKPDVLCMQELKVSEKEFPREPFENAGYHVAHHCQPAYNGVGIASLKPITDVAKGMDDGQPEAEGRGWGSGGKAPGDSLGEEARLIAGTVDGVRVLSAYFPNGQAVGSPAYEYKLRWMERLRSHLDRTYRREQPLLLCGDFNVAPDPRDVFEPKACETTPFFHPSVREAIEKIRAWGFVDAFRIHHEEGRVFSWWDYRSGYFHRGIGLRIDHVWASEGLAKRVEGSRIDRDARKGKLPSDHAPVIVQIADDPARVTPPSPPEPKPPRTEEPARSKAEAGPQGSLF